MDVCNLTRPARAITTFLMVYSPLHRCSIFRTDPKHGHSECASLSNIKLIIVPMKFSVNINKIFLFGTFSGSIQIRKISALALNYLLPVNFNILNS